jgi:glycosyltransferase involved in cell wall biosynthesis
VLSLLRVLARLTIVRRIICASEAARQQFQDLGQKAVAIPNAVDIQKFRPSPDLGAAVRKELAIPMDKPAVGIVGDLISLKGQHILLEAARLGSPDIHCLVVGNARPGDSESSDYAARLHRMATRNTLFTGYRDDLPALLNALDILVVASERETGPLVMLEALACGVPVVSTPVGRAPELVRPEALFPIGNAEALAERLRFWLADSQRLEVAKSAARTLAEERFALEQFQCLIRAEIERANL